MRGVRPASVALLKKNTLSWSFVIVVLRRITSESRVRSRASSWGPEKVRAYQKRSPSRMRSNWLAMIRWNVGPTLDPATWSSARPAIQTSRESTFP